MMQKRILIEFVMRIKTSLSHVRILVYVDVSTYAHTYLVYGHREWPRTYEYEARLKLPSARGEAYTKEMD